MTRKMIFLMGMVVLLGIPFSAKAQQAFKPVTLEAKKSVTIQAEDYNKGGKGVGYQARQMKYKNPAGNKFPIIGWLGLSRPVLQTKSRYQEMAAVGININMAAKDDWGVTSARAQTMLAASRGTGVNQVIGVKILQENPSLYKNDSEVVLYDICDEPQVNGAWNDKGEQVAKSFAEVLELLNNARTLDDSRMKYVNLLPIGQLGYETNYVKRFANEIGIGFLSFDHYPIYQNGNSIALTNNYFENLQVVSKISRETNQPMWSFVCSAQHLDKVVRDPSNTANPFWPMYFEMWSSLAYGAQCMQYFTYQQNSVNSNFGLAPLKYDSATGSWSVSTYYYAVGTLNRLLEHLTPVFLGAKVVNVGHIGSSRPSGTALFTKLPECVSRLSTTGAGFVVSHLKNGDDEYLMVVNHSISASQNFTINWKSGYTVKRVRADYSQGLIREAAGTSYTVGVADYLLFHWNINN